MSAADPMAVLVANHLRYDFGDPKNAANDRLIFSKGHASTLQLRDPPRGRAISDGASPPQVRQHARRASDADHPVGSTSPRALSARASIGVGMGLAAKFLDRLPSHVWGALRRQRWALSGSMWEAFEHASHYELR